MASPQRLARKPEARSEKVEDLVHRILRGLIRVPAFQRRLRWDNRNVVDLFDSIYRGYPIGSLLFYKRPATAGRVQIGPLYVDAEETKEAWWVVDGQQRLTALTASLAHPEPLPGRPRINDPYVVFFDAEQQEFRSPPGAGDVGSAWVPLPRLLDASQLTEWVFSWHHRDNEALRRVVFEAGSRIREYPIPLYLIEADEGTGVAELIYYRVNKAGKPLEWSDVYNALFAGKGTSPSTLAELASELAEVGMGRLDLNRLLTCLIALRGKDPTQSLAEHYRRDPEALRDAVKDGLPVLRSVLSFLRSHAEIPHLRLLPKSILLDILTRFFALHPDPGPRTRLLLVRWFWRAVLGGGAFEDRTLRRRGIAAVVHHQEEESVQRLLGLLRREPPRTLELPSSFDARADESRIALLALVHLGPRHLTDSRKIDVADLLEREDKAAFVKILNQTEAKQERSPANRLIQPRSTPVRQHLIRRLTKHGPEDPVLASHAIDPLAAACLRANDWEGFLQRRSELLTTETRRFADRMAAWGHNDRPSVEHLLAEVGGGA